MKKQLKNLAQKLVLATTLALAPYQTQAQNPDTQALHFIGNSLQHNAHHMRNFEEARFHHGLGSILHDTSHLIDIYEMENTQYNSTRHVIQRTPTANFYVYDQWQDNNNNGWADNSTELQGKDRNSFWEDDEIKLGVRTTGLRGSTVSYKMFCPNGEEIYSNSIKITANNRFDSLANFNNGLPKTLKNHGQGIYSAKFFIDNQHIGTRKFALKSNTQMDLCNYWKDLNGDDKLDKDGELSGLGKRVFNENEKFTPLLFTRNQKGKCKNVKIFNPKGEEVYTNHGQINSSSEWRCISINVSDLTSIHGPGTYLSAFYVDGESKGAISFELNGTQKPKNLEGYFLHGRFYPYEQKTDNFPGFTIYGKPLSQEDKAKQEYFEREKAMHREQHRKWAQQNPDDILLGKNNNSGYIGRPLSTNLSQTQKQTIKKFRDTIRQRANKMNKNNSKRRADPIGYDLSPEEILQLYKTHGNFSEQSIRKFIQP